MPGKKLLIVDDDPFFVKILTTAFTFEGFDVCSAENGEEAFLKAQSEKPHLIIMDVMMPKVSGYEATQKIRENLGTRNIPVIVVSGKAGMEEFFSDIPKVTFLHKTFQVKQLVDRVNSLIGNPHAKQQKHALLAGVGDLEVNSIRDLLIRHHFQVAVVLNEKEAITALKKNPPEIIFCQFWEDATVLDPLKITQELLSQPEFASIPFYVYCKGPLLLDAMKHFKPDKILVYREISELLRHVEGALEKVKA